VPSFYDRLLVSRALCDHRHIARTSTRSIASTTVDLPRPRIDLRPNISTTLTVLTFGAQEWRICVQCVRTSAPRTALDVQVLLNTARGSAKSWTGLFISCSASRCVRITSYISSQSNLHVSRSSRTSQTLNVLARHTFAASTFQKMKIAHASSGSISKLRARATSSTSISPYCPTRPTSA